MFFLCGTYRISFSVISFATFKWVVSYFNNVNIDIFCICSHISLVVCLVMSDSLGLRQQGVEKMSWNKVKEFLRPDWKKTIFPALSLIAFLIDYYNLWYDHFVLIILMILFVFWPVLIIGYLFEQIVLFGAVLSPILWYVVSCWMFGEKNKSKLYPKIILAIWFIVNYIIFHRFYIVGSVWS